MGMTWALGPQADGPVKLEGAWLQGTWQVQQGAFEASGLDNNVLRLGGFSPFGAQRFEATVMPEKALRNGTWAAAGIAVYFDGASFWRLSLVQSAADPNLHYAELLEDNGGVWQAQSTGTTKLQQIGPDTGNFPTWQWGKTYRFVLELTKDRIDGRIYEGDQVRFQTAFALDPAVPAVRMGWPALTTVDAQARFSGVSFSASAFGARKPALLAAQKPAVVVLDEPRPGLDEKLVPALCDQIARTGVDVRRATVAQLAGPDGLTVGNTDLLVIPHCQAFPVPLRAPLLGYLGDGGNLLALGGPIFQTWLAQFDGKWYTTDEVMANVKPEKHIFTFAATEPLKGWVRASADASQPETVTAEAAPPGAEGSAVKLALSNLKGWDTFQSPPGEGFFAPGQNLTTLWARGDAATPSMILEWKEKDGSRWIGTVKLTTEWKRYGLAPTDFKFWPDPPVKGRGGESDSFKPENAVIFSIGVAGGPSPLPAGPHTYWIADVGTAKAPFALPDVHVPMLESLCPWYKTYATPRCAGITARGDQALMHDFSGARIAATLDSPIVRSRGLGFVGNRYGRLIPLLDALDDTGAARGCAASTFVSLTPPFIHATWSHIGLQDDALLKGMDTLGPAVAQLCRSLVRGVYLTEAGADKASYWPEQNATVGAEALNSGREPVECTVTIKALGQRGNTVQTWTSKLTLQPGERQAFHEAWECSKASREVVTLVTDLSLGGASIDRIVEPVRLLDKPSIDKRELVTVRDGDFWRGGKRWNPVGTNYWPLYVSGSEPGQYNLGWETPQTYDPVLVERDLTLMESLGMNFASIQGGDPDCLPALQDFLMRAKAHGVKVNVFLNGADPRSYNDDQVKSFVTAGRLADTDAVCSYDISWEPRWGDYNERKSYDADWAAWIDEQYGSAQAAEALWKFACPRTPEGKITAPSDEQIAKDGDWRIMVAAYRRFVDDFLSRKYNIACSGVRKYDPNHLISHRVGYGGTGQEWACRVMAYDPVSGAKHLDFISPEGYGTEGEWKNFLKAGLITAYCRWAGNNAPVYWAEFGASIHPDYSPAALESQRNVWDGMCHMNSITGANGLAGWWWPGGYRVNENSDFGIIDPSAAPRPAALAVQKWAAQIASPKPRAKVGHTIVFDRDQYTIGLYGTWAKYADEYLANLSDNSLVALATAGDGKTTSDCPLTGVGGMPYTGIGPMRFVNGEFNWIEYRINGTAWRRVGPDGVIAAPAGTRVELRASLGNTGDAAWAATGAGKVSLIIKGEGPEQRLPLLADVARYKDGEFGPVVAAGKLAGETTLTLRLWTDRGGYFGEPRKVTLRVR
jgi:hypothetical protein